MGLSGELTAQDLDILLNAAPVPFDLSPPSVSRKGGNEEAGRACDSIIDLRGTCQAGLPSNPASVILNRVVVGWKAGVRP